MSSINVNHEIAAQLLASAWERVEDFSPPDKVWVQQVTDVMAAKDKTYKYILITGLLAKCANPKVHPRALQTGSALPNPFDARSLCHKVVVPFEKRKGDLWGLSNEPFVNKPARHPEHNKDNSQLRSKAGAANVHDVLEYIHRNSEEATSALILCLSLGDERARTQVQVDIATVATHGRVSEFLERFLEESDGGARLAAVTSGFVALLNDDFDVKVYPPNFSDHFAKTSGDVEIHLPQRGGMISAFECKHRPISVEDVHHGIAKAIEAGLSEYWFIYASGLLSEHDEEGIDEAMQSVAHEIDLYFYDIFDLASYLIPILNPERRARFGEVVVRHLRVDMKRADVANEAAELWNELGGS